METLPLIANITPYLGSAQQDPTDTPQENIRKSMEIILAFSLAAKILKAPRYILETYHVCISYLTLIVPQCQGRYVLPVRFS